MQLAEFVNTLEDDLQLRGAPFDWADLVTFVDSAWPLIEDNPDVPHWAAEFLERSLAGGPAK
jgi:hypothetical protein